MNAKKIIIFTLLAILLLPTFACGGGGGGLSEADEHFNAGVDLQKQSLWNEAIVEYNKAIELDSEMAIAYSNRGYAYFMLGEFERAIEDLGEAIRLDPHYAGSYNNRGRAYAQLGEFERAIEDLDEAIRLDPQLAGAYYNRGCTYGNLPRGRRYPRYHRLYSGYRSDKIHCRDWGTTQEQAPDLGRLERQV